MARRSSGSKGSRGGAGAEARKYDLFVDRTSRVLRRNEAQLAEDFSKRSMFTCRVNRLKVSSRADVIERGREQGIEFEPVDWYPDGLVFDCPKQTVAESQLSINGDIFVQNASSYLPVLALQPQPGEDILDACAAPGGKSSHIAALTSNSARLWVNDGIESRMPNLLDVQRVLGFETVETTTHPTQYLDKFVDAQFDRILLDAQCSGEGMVVLEHQKSLQFWSMERITKYRRLQTKMLDTCFRLLKPGGVLVYSTCTFAPEENEAPISTLLSRKADAVVEPLRLDISGVLPGVTKWERESFDPSLRGALRVRPSEYLEGFFLCRIRKLAEGIEPVTEPLDLAEVGRSVAGD